MIAIDMPMPRNCGECQLMDEDWCYAKNAEYVGDCIDDERRPVWCPLIDLTDDGK